MKKLIMALAITSVSYASAQASEKKSIETVVVVADSEDKRTAVKLDELPEEVKKSLAGETYAGWTPTAAFWVEGLVSYYEIEMLRGDDKSIVKLDKTGQLVK